MTKRITNNFSRDVTDELQAFLDVPSCDVYLPGGTYKISRPLKIHSNTRLSLRWMPPRPLRPIFLHFNWVIFAIC